MVHKFGINMRMIPRSLVKTIIEGRKDGFVTVIYGARRVGKTVLLNQILENYRGEKTLMLNGDTQETRDLLSNTSEVTLSGLVDDYSIIVIDEVQRIANVGLSLKIIIDKFPTKKILVTGSSSLELTNGLQETLTGRALRYKLFPLSTRELGLNLEKYQRASLLPDQMLYGGYPYVGQLSTSSQKQDYLRSIVEDYLFRDLFVLERTENPDVVKKLAILLAFQIGSEVSLSELARQLLVSVKTVARYLDLLEKCFVLFGVGAYSTNLRNEVSRGKKYYFYDLGIRNALTGSFLPLDVRTDVGALWENFLVIERFKKMEYERISTSGYFWRDYAQAEIDWMELSGGKLAAFEFKWGESGRIKTPKNFRDSYGIEAKLVNRENYLDFIW